MSHGAAFLKQVPSNHQRNSPSSVSRATPAVNDAASCPFSTKFPPYRIDLTSPAEPKKSLISLPKAWYKQRLTSRGAEWLPDQDGLSALTTLWRRADTMNVSSSDDEQSCYWLLLAFPDAPPRSLHQFVEIFNWHAQHQQHHHHDKVADSHCWPTTVQAEYELFENAIPTVRLTQTTSRSSATTTTTHIPAKDEKVAPSSLPDHATVTRRTQAWVQRLLVEQGICPFTRTAKKSGQGLKDVGVVAANIDYRTSHAVSPTTLIADSLDSIQNMLTAGPTEISSVLLAAPAFDDQWEYWSGPYFAVLQACVVASQTADTVGVVCFHPSYQTPDGSTWSGFGQMHSVPRLQQWCNRPVNARGVVVERERDHGQQPLWRTWEQAAAGGAWQRRTPHATLNVLRADQLAAAEDRRDSAKLYPANIAKLVDVIGVEQLEEDLQRERNLE